MKYHCFFEQSGTFKNALKKLGAKAFDYDVLDMYGETDYKIDLFDQIERGYLEVPSVFDRMGGGNDFIIAFFPCTRFEDQCNMCFLGNANGMQKWSDERKLNYDLYLHEGLSKNYSLITKLAIICLRKHIPLVIENPRGTLHYLSRYWSLKPKIVDMDRSMHGDYYKKPTQYWFLNCEPKNNLVFEVTENHKRGTIEFVKGGNRQVQRSEIHPDYAMWFIKSYIAEQKEDGSFYL